MYGMPRARDRLFRLAPRDVGQATAVRPADLRHRGHSGDDTGYLPSVKFLPDPSWSPGQSGANGRTSPAPALGKPEPLATTSDHDGNRPRRWNLLAAIRENRQPNGSIYDARAAVEMIVAVFESQRQGKPVALPLANRQNPLAMLA